MNTNHSNPAVSSAKNRGDLKVLLVDDDAFHLDVLAAMFRTVGITRITLANSAAKALKEMSANQDFDLLVTDLHMPDMDGFLFMGQVASDGYIGALIIVSGQNNDVRHAASLVARLRRIRLLGTLQKPVTRAALTELISVLA